MPYSYFTHSEKARLKKCASVLENSFISTKQSKFAKKIDSLLTPVSGIWTSRLKHALSGINDDYRRLPKHKRGGLLFAFIVGDVDTLQSIYRGEIVDKDHFLNYFPLVSVSPLGFVQFNTDDTKKKFLIHEQCLKLFMALLDPKNPITERMGFADATKITFLNAEKTLRWQCARASSASIQPRALHVSGSGNLPG